MWRLFSQQGRCHFALLFRERNQRRCAMWRSQHWSRRCQRSSATHVVPARIRTKIRMPQCKAFGCFNEQGKCHNEDGSHKSVFFKFPDPTKSKESQKLCAKWLANLKNANLPLHVRDFTWSGAHKVCEDHFTPVFKDKVRMCLQMTLLPLLVSNQPAEYSGMGHEASPTLPQSQTVKC